MAREVLLAVVLGAHGLKGELRVRAFTARAETLGAYGPLHARDGRAFTVKLVRAAKDGEAVVAFREIADRDAAEALKGLELFIARGALPEADKNEFYHADLLHLEAWDKDGRRLGKIAGVHNYGAGDVLEIACDDGSEILIAFTRDNVPEIDLAAGRVVVTVPEEDEADERGTVE
jgi:16S rRNA processing protein RimM